MVHLAEVYDDFAFGRAEPVAIRQLFATLRPSYGLLLGDASYDYRDQLGLNPLPGVPPWETGFYLPQPGYGSPAAARDAWYSDFDGDGYTPDMILGRITCRTPDELNAYLRKLTRYELGNRGSWCRRVILLADDEWIGYDQPGYEDRIGLDHVTYCENINGHWGPVFEPVKVYLTEFPFVAFGEKPGARDMLHRALEQGALLMCFFGHGDGANLTREAALTLQEIPSLNNEGRSPFCFFGSCGVGRWDDTRNECIAEELTRLTGAIATVGASKATAAQSNLFFAQRLFDSLLHNPGISVGQAFTAALPTTPIYHLFGAPCLPLALPDTGGRVYLNGDTLGHGRRYRFGGVLPVSQGFVASTLFGPKWLRTYRTTNRYAHPNPVTYVLSGEELYRGIHRVTDRMFQGEFLVPAHPTRGIRPVVNGSYLEVARSTRLSLVGFSGGASWALLKDGLALDSTPVAQADSAGPELTLAADGRQLLPSETNAVASSFTLRGRVSDPSGILISPAQTGEAFYLYQNDFRQRLPLADRFSYDLESCTSGTFSLPITLTGTIDSLVVVASDNFLNYSTVRVLVRASVSGALTISNPLVFPNPVTGPALFTFQISEPAAVTIRIHTLSGRLVRMIEQLEGTSGYNQVPWDGCDQAGVSVPSGVYPSPVTARKSLQSIEPREQETIIRDRLVVRR
ncbi:MAG: C25 family cysteine peptidase [candidate division WOR-3 bacterium]